MREIRCLSYDICRVCRCESASDRPLFHPCICTGSIKFIHQDCLLQWLRYSRKEYCELCKHRFSFTPIYSPDMPKRLPIADILTGLARSMGTAVRCWIHYSLVALAWLGIVPLAACRIYRCLFTGSVSSLFTLPLDLLSTDNLLLDIFHGCFVVACSLGAFISLVWLREQILHGGGPDWLDQELQPEPDPVANLPANDVAAPQNQANEEENEPAQNQQVQPAAQEQNENNENQEEIGANNNNNNNNNNNDAGGGAEENWNPIEWDRAGEELTWERLLGLDGSLVFLEHAFWVISLNTLFILVFAFCPYHIGHFTVVEFKMKSWVTASHFEGLLTALCGYCVVGIFLVLLHALASLTRLNKSKRILGLCYVVVKVALLFVVEIGVFPLIGGWWLDICSLALFDASLKDREASFKIAPGTSMFIHWLVGMVYVFYFASFILLLREVLRPGVLWFLRNLNDPNFNPLQEMIHLPIVRHARRFLASIVIFGSTVLLMLWLPIKIIHTIWPSFMPYHITLSSDTPVSELSLELLLLQVILPALLEQGHTRVWLKVVIRHWCVAVSHVLGLRSYLLGDMPLDPQDGEVIIGGEGIENDAEGVNRDGDDADPNEQRAPDNANILPPAPPPNIPNIGIDDPLDDGLNEMADALGGGLGAAHQALLQRDSPTGFQSYIRPPWFGLRILALVLVMCVSLTVTSILCLTLPVLVGRQCMYFALGDTKIHELYTGACGLYVCLLAIRGLTLFLSWISLGWSQVIMKCRVWAIMGGKAIVALTVVAIIIPLMVGILVQIVAVIPLRVPLHQTPILFFWQDWALGVLYTKIICAIVMMGPNWWLKAYLEQIYLGGLRNLDLNLVVFQTSFPVIAILGSFLAIPHVFSQSIAPIFVPSSALLIVERRIYPALLVISVVTVLVVVHIVQFTRLVEHIKNDKYLVGRRLVNYNHQLQMSLQQEQREQSAAIAQNPQPENAIEELLEEPLVR